jgi:hypothetical protein
VSPTSSSSSSSSSSIVNIDVIIIIIIKSGKAARQRENRKTEKQRERKDQCVFRWPDQRERHKQRGTVHRHSGGREGSARRRACRRVTHPYKDFDLREKATTEGEKADRGGGEEEEEEVQCYGLRVDCCVSSK